MVQLLILFSMYTIIFLIGMFMMKSGFYALSGHRLKQWLLRFTNTPLQGFFTGTIVTALLQSSSAVMVITVGLVSTGYLTFRQSIGVILGSNIGSTITTEMMTLDVGDSVIPMLFIGAALVFFGYYRLAYSTGMIIVGLASLFFAMGGFGQLAKPLSAFPIVDEWLQKTNLSPFSGILIGVILTAIIHSSAATIGIAMGFLNEHILTLPAGIAILLGANIGTCITGLLASIGSTYEARLTAYTHLWFNVIGVIIFYFFIDTLAFIASKLSNSPDVQLAHVSVLFNVVCSLAALPFARWIEAAIFFFHGKRS